jgi:hypothetical protein
MNNNTLTLLCLAVIILLSCKLYCNNDKVKANQAYINALENENAEIAADRMLVLDSVDVLIKRLDQSETEKLNATLWYLAQTRETKNKMLKRYGNVQIDTFNNAYLDSNAVDSVNKLAIAYDFEVKDGKTKDTIITHLTNANLQADSLLTNKDKIITAQEKNNKTAQKLAKTWQHISYGLAALTAIIWIAAK